MQGYEIAKTIANFGAKTTLISGPTALEPRQMLTLSQLNQGMIF